mgnify:CR=1 FL=1
MKNTYQVIVACLILAVISFVYHLQREFGYMISREESLAQGNVAVNRTFYGFSFFGSWVYFVAAILSASLSLIRHRVVRISLSLITLILTIAITWFSVLKSNVPLGPGVSDMYFELNGQPIYLYASLLFTSVFMLLTIFRKSK